jgi:site-specific DNA-methyltransferase (adenine-specific)
VTFPDRLTEARRQLEKAETVPEIKRVIDLAEAARVLARKARLGMEAHNEAAEIRFRAERKAGAKLLELRESRQRARSGKESQLETLSSLDVDRNEAHRWQAIAKLSESVFERLIAEPKQKVPQAEINQSAFLAEAALDRYEARRQRFLESGQQMALTDGDWQMEHGDFRDVLAGLDAGSVDAIVTDPPYGDEFADVWFDLGAVAKKLLRHQGVLICWSGNRRIPDVTAALSAHLRYGWTFCLSLPGSQVHFRESNVYQGWKPVFVYVQEGWPPHGWGPDVLVSPKREKDRFEWQQSTAPAAELIERLVPANGLVVDPFTGPGTFGLAAIEMGRRFLGVELDQARYHEARQVLAGFVP